MFFGIFFFSLFAKALAQTNNEELDENKASIIIWEGEKKVSWHSEDFSSLDFTSEMFVKEKLLAGMLLRVGIKDYKYNSKITLLSHGMKFKTGDSYEALYKSIGTYYETILTDSLLASIREKGLTIQGEYLTVTSLSFVDNGWHVDRRTNPI